MQACEPFGSAGKSIERACRDPAQSAGESGLTLHRDISDESLERQYSLVLFEIL
jgi:hypothetical protein